MPVLYGWAEPHGFVMKPERWQEIKQLCHSALQHTASERATFLDQACAGDEALLRDVEALLAQEKQAEHFMEAPALEVAAQEMAEDKFPSFVGKQVSHYQILSRLGAGGMGEVYLARDTRLDRIVALKILPADVGADQDHMRRFVQEAKAASAINHPNVATVYDIGEGDGISFIVMEYVEGQTLAARMHGRPLDFVEIVAICLQVAQALCEAHARGITHRDIKPANLMLTPRGQVKVLDFGLAKITRPQEQALAGDLKSIATTAAGIIMGTVQYMSPEQVLGRDVDHRSDIFSLGIVLYQMATGALPFAGASAGETMDRILHAQPEAVPHDNEKALGELERIVLKCLEKKREWRYQSARELLEDLSDLQRDSGSGVSMVERVTPQRRSQNRTQLATGSADIEMSRTSTKLLHGEGWPGLLKTVGLRSWVLGLTALAATCVVVLVFLILGNRPTLSFSPRDWILITDFDNQTANPLFDRALDTAFTVSLEQSSHANVFPRARIGNALKRMGKNADERINEETGREICIRENIRGLISCSISRFGQQYALSARLIDPHNGDTVRSYMERALNQDNILQALDAITTRIRRDLGESLNSISASNRQLPQVTTASLEALKLYTDGVAAWNKGQHQQAVKLYESALKYDPDFAKAHASLGSAYSSFVFNERMKGKEHLEKAIQLSARTTDRERLSIEIEYHHGLGHFAEAAQLYDMYLKTYPDDSRIRSGFGNLLMRNGQPEEAIRQYKEVIRIAPDSANAYINIATSYVESGKSRDALIYYAKAFDLEPSWITQGNLNHEYGFALLSANDEAKAREVLTLALATPIRPAALRSLALLELYHGEYRAAGGRLAEAILLNESAKVPLSKARNHLFMSIVHEGEGNRVGLLTELDKAAKCLDGLGVEASWICSVGIGYARSGARGKAARILEAAKQQIDRKNPNQSMHLHLLEGEIELAKGNRDRAIELFKLADLARHTPLTVESLARGYTGAGKTDQAIEAYETLIGMRGRSLGWEAQQLWVSAQYHLAKAYLSRGEKDKASKLVDGLLGLWKEADPELPLLKEARRMRSESQN